MCLPGIGLASTSSPDGANSCGIRSRVRADAPIRPGEDAVPRSIPRRTLLRAHCAAPKYRTGAPYSVPRATASSPTSRVAPRGKLVPHGRNLQRQWLARSACLLRFATCSQQAISAKIELSAREYCKTPAIRSSLQGMALASVSFTDAQSLSFREGHSILHCPSKGNPVSLSVTNLSRNPPFRLSTDTFTSFTRYPRIPTKWYSSCSYPAEPPTATLVRGQWGPGTSTLARSIECLHRPPRPQRSSSS
jgi:hypothetical protein